MKHDETHLRDRGVLARFDAQPRGQSMLWFVRDLPNAITLAGLVLSLLAIFWAVTGMYAAAMVALLWASLFDWFDGPVAKRMANRPEESHAFGVQLDSFSDLVSSSVAPAIILLGIGEWSAWYLPGAILIVMAGVIRLSFFNVYGLSSDQSYQGLPVPANTILLTSVFLVYGLVDMRLFQTLLYASMLLMATLNVAHFRFPKPRGGWYAAIVVYTLVLTLFYAWRMPLASQ